MSIVQSIQRNTVTLMSNLTYMDINLGITLSDLSRAELVIDVRAAQSTSNLTSMCITGRLTSTSNVRIERGGSLGTMVVHFHIIEYTAASGVVVERGNGILDLATKDIALDSKARAKCYSRLFMKTSSNSSFQAIMMTHDVTSDTNIQVLGNGADSNISFDWQRIYIPDATVHHINGVTSGASYAVSLSGLGIVKEESFCIVSMRNGSNGIDNDEFKGAHLSSNTQCDIYSIFNDSHNFTLQIVHRPNNRVERNKSIFSLTSFDVNWLNPVDWACSYVNLSSPYGYFSPAAYTNNAQDFMAMSQLNGDYAITLSKFIGLVSSEVVSEVVYIDGNPIVASSIKAPFWTFSSGGL